MQVVVRAKENSLTGGEGKTVGRIQRGSLLVITCRSDDTWRLGNELFVNANGRAGTTYNRPDGQEFNTGSMVASLDNGVTFFPVGTHLEMTVLQGSENEGGPELKLYCWDSDSENNQNFIIATVYSYTPGTITIEEGESEDQPE